MSCATCGTALSATQTRCLVCGRQVEKIPQKPEITLTNVIGILVIEGEKGFFSIKRVSGDKVVVRGEITQLKISIEPKSFVLRLEMVGYLRQDERIWIEVPFETNIVNG